MYDPPETADPADPPYELPRPVPPRTWRDRVDDVMVGGPSPGRLLVAVVALAVAAVVGWRLMASPPAPPEMEIPFAEQGAAPAPAGAPTAAGPGAVPADPAAAPPGDAGPGGVAPGPGAPAAGEVVVHVAGAVVAPGVQRLPGGARVDDAVDAAGGATPDADLGRINLAAVLIDGQQVYVLRVGEAPPSAPTASAGSATANTAGTEGQGALVDINTASATQLEELPGVGPITAQAIISHREQSGPFASVDDLLDVRGIGEAKLEALRDLATV